MHRNTDPIARLRLTRRALFGSAIAVGLQAGRVSARQGSRVTESFGLLIRANGPAAGLELRDPESGALIYSFATEGRPETAWASPLPGTAFVQTDTALALVDCSSGRTLPVALPRDVAIQILPKSIQFRGSLGTTKALIGTAASAEDTYVVDLTTGERTRVAGMISATPPPATLQNVALAPDDGSLIVWDGRRTWIIDLPTTTPRLLGTGQFTFSAGYLDYDGRIAYSQQMATGMTELHIQQPDGAGDELLDQSPDILVSLPLPSRNALLLDERNDAGGILGVLELATGRRADLLEYQGATNIVQFSPDGEYALVGIEGEAGRDWYRLVLDVTAGSALLFADLADAEVRPGFDFHSPWAVAAIGADELNDGAVIAADLVNGETTVLIEGITSDAAVGQVVVAPAGPGALVSIDSFTEFAVHFLDLELGADVAVDLMKGGSGVIAPTADQFAIAYDLNTGGVATIMYDRAGSEGATIQGKALAWI